jgi:hypothetical protein
MTKTLKKALYVVVLCWSFRPCITLAQSSPSLTYQLKAKDFETSDSAQLLVTADVPTTYGRVSIEFVVPPQFEAEPATLNFDPQPGKRIVAVSVRRVGEARSNDYSILVHATAQPSGGSGLPFAVDQVVTFTYTRRLENKFYFLLGLAGFILGYLLRIVTAVLRKVPAPAPVLPTSGDDGPDGPLTAFVRAHYYRVDFLVSLILAFLVLLYLMRDGHPPDSAAAWYGAILTGSGLGFLTNNDLLARIKT